MAAPTAGRPRPSPAWTRRRSRRRPRHQLLVADRINGNAPANNAFILELPPDFKEAYADAATEPNPPQRVLGSCPEGDIPIIFERAGHTDLDNRFYFRDLVEPNQQGLHPNGFNLWYSDCERGGGMHEQQGLLFVR